MSATRVIVVAGKGGVGKTTVACATAVTVADTGRRTLVVSLDRAHSLGDVLGINLNHVATPVPGCPQLEAMEMDPQAELGSGSAALRDFMQRLLSYLGVQGVAVQELAVFPGLEELLVLARLAEFVESGEYDLIVTDMAPTASSLRYLSFPDMMEGVLGKLVTWDQRFAQLLRPFQGKALKMPVPENEVYDSLRDLSERLSRLKVLLQDSSRTVVRLVMVPESIVLEETRRAFTYLSLFGLTVDSVIANRIFPPAAGEGYFASWRHVQSRVLGKAKETLPGLPILQLEYLAQEIVGVNRLRESARSLYGTDDPYEFRQTVPPITYTKDKDATVLSLSLPGVKRGALDLRQRSGDLIITVGGWRRTLLLPDFMSGQTITKARLADGKLTVRFEPGSEPRP